MPIDYSNPINQVRQRISDRVRFDSESFLGDGSALSFKLKQGAPFSTITAASAQAFITTPAVGYSATGATFDPDQGRVTFVNSISANSAVQIQYSWSVFSDDELNFIYYSGVDGGSVAGAALQCVKTLMFDGLRRSRWMAPDGTQYDDTAALRMLDSLYEKIHEELREDPAGGIESWGEQQANYAGPYSD